MYLIENLVNNSMHDSTGSYLVCLLFVKTSITSVGLNKR